MEEGAIDCVRRAGQGRAGGAREAAVCLRVHVCVCMCEVCERVGGCCFGAGPRGARLR